MHYKYPTKSEVRSAENLSEGGSKVFLISFIPRCRRSEVGGGLRLARSSVPHPLHSQSIGSCSPRSSSDERLKRRTAGDQAPTEAAATEQRPRDEVSAQNFGKREGEGQRRGWERPHGQQGRPFKGRPRMGQGRPPAPARSRQPRTRGAARGWTS